MRTAASASIEPTGYEPRPSGFAWKRTLSSWGLASGCAALVACTASAEDVRPPADQLYFPSGIVVSPDESVMFVANANSELRYDSGSIGVIALDRVRDVIARWVGTDRVASDGCEADPDHRETLICEAPSLFKPEAAVRIGNFATDIALQDFGSGVLRLLVPTRGDPSISWADYDGSRLTCVSGSASFELCDDDHRLTAVRNDPDLLSIPSEPFGVYGGTDFAIVTHLSAGAVTLIDSRFGRAAEIVDIRGNLFAPDAFGVRAATGVAGRTLSASNESIVYVGGRTENRIQSFTVGRIEQPYDVEPPPGEMPPKEIRPEYLLPGNFFFLKGVGGNLGQSASSDTRGMTFSPDNRRLYVVNRNPPSLQIIDTSEGPTGAPRNTLTGATDICRQASWVTVVGTGDDERAYVSCFQDGQIYVVDPRGASQVEDIITVGRGPYGVTAAKAHNQLFISNFLEDTVAVVDVAPDSPHRNRVVLRIGKPKVNP